MKNSSPILRHLFARLINLRRKYLPRSYSARFREEEQTYAGVEDINDLPRIFDYWAEKHLVPMLSELGVSNPDEFFAKYLARAASATRADRPSFVSIGAGNCDTEVRVARLLRQAGLDNFTLECCDLNAHMLERGRNLAIAEGVAGNLTFVECDLNKWTARQQYDAVMANQSLHHIVNLEGLFDEIRRVLRHSGSFVISDIVGRNGHQRWPEALKAVRQFWAELPEAYRYNIQLRRHEDTYENWDCSHEGFEGIRAQDILPLLIQRFNFDVFFGFGNAIDVFVDRSFGHHFDPNQDWDRAFIDKVHDFDERSFQSGNLTPTHMMAVVTTSPAERALYVRGLSPYGSLRSNQRKLASRARRSSMQSH